MTNECREAVKIAIRFLSAKDVWTTAGWWTFTPGESAFLSNDDEPVRSNNRIAYFYAKGDTKVWKGDHDVALGGQVYGFRQTDLNPAEGRSRLTLTCK